MNNNNISLVSQRLKKIMVYKDITPIVLSQKSGVSVSQIYKILSTNSEPTVKTLHRMLSSLSISLEDFFNFSLCIKEIPVNDSQPTVNETLKIIAHNLKRRQTNLSRLERLTQNKIAENLNFTDYRYVNFILNGRSHNYINIKVSTLFKICNELGLPINEIYTLFN